GQFGAGQQGRVLVTLHLADRDRRIGGVTGGVVDAVEAVFPALVDQPTVGGAPVFDKPVAVPVAVFFRPGQRGVGGGQQGPHEVLVGAPPPALGEQHDEKRCRVHRTVVNGSAEHVGARRPAADL